MLKDLLGVTITTEDEDGEFVVHVQSDYDYRYISSRTQKKDSKRGFSRIPGEPYRIDSLLETDYFNEDIKSQGALLEQQVSSQNEMMGIKEQYRIKESQNSQEETKSYSRDQNNYSQNITKTSIEQKSDSYNPDLLNNQKVSINLGRSKGIMKQEESKSKQNGKNKDKDDMFETQSMTSSIFQDAMSYTNDQKSIFSQNQQQYYYEGEFEELSDINSDILSERSGRSSTILSKSSSDSYKLEDFQTLRIIGQGSYGKVYLVKNIKNGLLYAMKILRKDKLVDQKNIHTAYIEKEILQTSEHQFIMKLEYLFQNDKRIYFLMKFVEGGDLYRHLQKRGRFKEKVVQFYLGQVLLAIGYLHQNKILYRDLKLENILLNRDGYIVISDFGLSKILSDPKDQAFSVVGTAAYVAPEILKQKGYDKTVDWWAFGILMYEMLHGIPPFYDKNLYLMFGKIQNDSYQPQYSDDLSENARDLLTQLLQKDHTKRLGYKNDMNDIMQHPFFSDLKFKKLEQKKRI
ncbi:protein kinase domain containing protein [Stylonychia lemnae]|uniref:Protein kinase domain containing protein n=1 Tax=Stylonychia lemnae TaxID=5949 RepID=A0A078B7K4_STYLE|nr:protein kinase domain containing protein [Stylonychia lemnae]|eukprot:CDW89282.1 protein kinase domain containing protein [Stylonychia lemnae]